MTTQKTDLVSFDDFAGGGGSAPSSSPTDSGVTRSPANLSFEEFAGGSEATTTQRAKGAASDAWGFLGESFDTALSGWKKLGGEAAAIADLVLSIPGFTVNVGAQLGGTLRGRQESRPALVTGPRHAPTDQVERRFLRPIDTTGTNLTPYAVGREAAHQIGEPLMNPVKKVLDLFKSGEAYEKSKTTAGMTWLTEQLEAAGLWAERASGGRISRDAVPMAAETLMASALAVGAKGKPAIDPVIVKRMREQAQKLREQAEIEVQDTTLTPQEFQARAPIQQQINDLLGIRTPAQEAQLTRQRRKQVSDAFAGKGELTPQQKAELELRRTRVYESPEASAFAAEERLGNQRDFTDHPRALEEFGAEQGGYEVGNPPAAAANQRPFLPEGRGRSAGGTLADAAAALQKPGWERTAEDLLAIREARKRDGGDLPLGTKTLAAAGVTGALLLDDDLRAVAAELGKDLAGPAGAISAMFVPVAKASPWVAKAKALEKAGKPRAEIWKELGIFQGKDGVWRREISDHASALPEGLERNQFNDKLIAGPKLGQSMPLSQLLDHKTLYEQFPELKNAEVKSVGLNFNLAGAFDSSTNTFYIAGGDPKAVRSTLLHEIEHYIQSKGGMARGGSANQFLRPEVAQFSKEIEANIQAVIEKNPEWAKINKYSLGSALEAEKAGRKPYDFQRAELEKARALPEFEEMAALLGRRGAVKKLKDYAYGQYRRIAGEVEARAVEKRADMTPDERRATPPWESFDVPEAEFILHQGRGSASMQEAVKGPGGMWHPEAVERLSDPIKSALVRGLEDRVPPPEDAFMLQGVKVPQYQWADKAIRNYLNRYAGTEKDPLKDVEIPFGEGTKRWEEITDATFRGTPAKEIKQRPQVMQNEDFSTYSAYDAFDNQIGERYRTADEAREVANSYKPPEWLEKAQPDERIWTDFHGHKTSREALTSYLSHVGDYLRQNVKPEELQRYDLVRAVRETAANDARMAKQTEKAQADSTKDLPVHKAYPDGFKWVELKLPEKLTPEQQKQVRRMKDEEIMRDLDVSGESYGELEKGGYEAYVAVGPDGKPIKNAYTGEFASGTTPEEAWLAGRLAEEGNTMGHCVGGYCEPVASGGSRIFSLRDPKGKAHVTVEVAPPDVRRDSHSPQAWWNQLEPAQRDKFVEEITDRQDLDWQRKAARHPAYLEWVRQQPQDVLQIKGKQNRAPNKEYLPYVQDFVREGKWGEVGDLGNTGMIELSKTIQERHNVPRYITQEEAAKLDQKMDGFRPRGEEGFVDQQLVAGMAGLGLGGIVGWAMTDDPSGALMGALAGGSLAIPGVRRRLKQAVDAVDYGLGNLSTRIGDISPALKLRAREYERRVLTRSHDELHRVVDFMKERQRLPGSVRDKFDQAVLTNDPVAIAELIKGRPEMVAAWREVRNVLNGLGEQLTGHGRFKTLLDDYFPRLVKDVEGLKRALNTADRTRLEQAIDSADKRAIKDRGTPLTDIERSAIINRELQGFRRSKGYQPGFAKGRKVDDITAAIQPFYFTPSESLYAYIRGAVQDLEMARFFGRDLVQTEKGSARYTNLDASIGNVVGRELAEGKIDYSQAKQLEEMLKNRFHGGERTPNRLVQEARNLGNMGLLGNIVSAVTQVSDTAMAVYAQDLRSTLTAVARQLSGREKITARDFGLADHIAEEFVSQTKTADWLNKVFKYSSFSMVDRFGKTTHLNAAFARGERLSRTPGGVKVLEREYGQAFGDDFPRLVQDLNRGQLTERVRAYLFSELSDMQPISKMEMPEAYLKHPNGRLMYMLKTFMLKQIDVLRRDAYGEMKKGNVGKGIKNLTEYALVLGIAGATTEVVKDWIMGREVSFGTADIAENVLKTFGWSEYTRAKIAAGKPAEAVGSMLLPPWRMVDDIVSRDPRAVQYIPIVGKLYYSWELGGKERAEIARKRKTGEELSEEAKEYRRQQREKRRQQREAQ